MAILVDDVEKVVERVRALSEEWGCRVHRAMAIRGSGSVVDLGVFEQSELEATLASLRPPCLLVQPAFRSPSIGALLAPVDPTEQARQETAPGEPVADRMLAAAIAWPQAGVLLRAIVAQRDEWAAVKHAVGHLRLDEPILTIRKPPFEQMVNELGARRLADGMLQWLRERGHSRVDLQRDAERFADEAIEELGPAPEALPEATARVLRDARKRTVDRLRRGT